MTTVKHKLLALLFVRGGKNDVDLQLVAVSCDADGFFFFLALRTVQVSRK
jgi:hypothetical protein